jgi:hypothetical protein
VNRRKLTPLDERDPREPATASDATEVPCCTFHLPTSVVSPRHFSRSRTYRAIEIHYLRVLVSAPATKLACACDRGA